MKIFSIPLSLCFLAPACFGQDLNKLQSRVEKLFELRTTVNMNKRLAVQYVETPSRDRFLESRPLPMIDARVLGFEFTADPKVVQVIFNAKVIIPDIGIAPRTGRELWVWDKKDWFLRLEDFSNPFDLSRNAPLVEVANPVPFEFSPKHIDLGKHPQGAVLKGSVEFKSKRKEIFLLLPAELPGLSFGAPIWKSDEEGHIEFQLDTALMFEDVRYVAEFAVTGLQEQRTRTSFELAAQIEPRLRVTQIPPFIDPAKPPPVAIQVENLSDTAFSFKDIFVTNDAFRLEKEPKGTVGPGQLVMLTFVYNGSTRVEGTQIVLTLSEPILGKPAMTFPLKLQLPPPRRPGFTREELEDILRKSKR
jgi:hypothetical protein